jgi:hypothetical protein
MAIRGLATPELVNFNGGRATRGPFTAMDPKRLLAASNLFLRGDGRPRVRNGYTSVLQDLNGGAVNLATPVKRFFDFQRQSDSQQFVLIYRSGIEAIVQGGVVVQKNVGRLSWIPADGSGGNWQETQLSDPAKLEAADTPFTFGTSVFGLYCVNGANMYCFYDTGTGGLSGFNLGLHAPPTAPTVALGAARFL